VKIRVFLATAAIGLACLHQSATARQAAAGTTSSAATVSATAAVEDTIAQRMQACVGCHGEAGRATRSGFFPRIAGKPAGYLYNQLKNFQQGLRRYAAMEHLLLHLSDDYLREIAEYFAGLDLPYPPPVRHGLSPADQKLAEQLVFEGQAERDIPACIACHGDKMAGAEPAMPGLLALPTDYLLAQFGAWRNGLRHATEPDCMAQIANRLTPEEIAAVSRWLSAQSLPAGTRHASAASEPLPIRCGSGEASAASATDTDPAPGSSASSATGSDPIIVRGAYLARAGNCVGCHTRQGGPAYAGGRAIATPFGAIYASNITPDAETGIGDWSAQAFWQAMHEGRSKDGRMLYPAFPYPNFTRVTREDSDALFAYLQSLPSVKAANREHALRFPYDTQAALAIWRTLFFKAGNQADDPGRDASWNRGRYLVEGLGHCSACHTGRNAFGAEREDATLSGEMIENASWYAPSLTDPREAGLQEWPHEQIVELLRDGTTNSATVAGPMAEVVATGTSHLDAADLVAIASYLKDLPVRSQANDSQSVASLPVLEFGGQLYATHCAACHGDDGRGVASIYPALAGNRAVTLSMATNVIQTILKGGFAPATPGNPRPFGMPPFVQTLGPDEVAAVATYIRQSWGNDAPSVSGLEVHRLR